MEVPYFEKLNIGFDDIIAAFPSDLLVSAVYWQHDLFTWMCISDSDNPAENYYPTDDRTIVFAENQRVGLRILKNDEGIVTYIGLELETVKTEGVDFILYLARTAQACTLTPLFFYEKTFSKPIQPMLLNSADFEK